MEYYPSSEQQQNRTVNEYYAPVETMANSNIGFMTTQFIRRAVFSDGTAEYRSPMEPGQHEPVKLRIRVAKGNASAVVCVVGSQRLTMGVAYSDQLFDYYECT